MCTWKGTEKLGTVPKLYCNPEDQGLGKVMWMAKRHKQKYKLLQSIYNLMEGWNRYEKVYCKTGLG